MTLLSQWPAECSMTVSKKLFLEGGVAAVYWVHKHTVSRDIWWHTPGDFSKSDTCRLLLGPFLNPKYLKSSVTLGKQDFSSCYCQ